MSLTRSVHLAPPMLSVVDVASKVVSAISGYMNAPPCAVPVGPRNNRESRTLGAVLNYLLVRLQKSNRLHSAKLGTAVEEGNLKDEEIADQLTAQLLDERGRRRRRAACGEKTCQHSVRTNPGPADSQDDVSEKCHGQPKPPQQGCVVCISKTGRGELKFARVVFLEATGGAAGSQGPFSMEGQWRDTVNIGP